MDRLFENEKNPNEHLNCAPQENTDSPTTLEARINFIKTLIQETEIKISEQEKNGVLSEDSDKLRIKIFKAILEDLYDTKYIGAPVHKQKQLHLFQEYNSKLESELNELIEESSLNSDFLNPDINQEGIL